MWAAPNGKEDNRPRQRYASKCKQKQPPQASDAAGRVVLDVLASPALPGGLQRYQRVNQDRPTREASARQDCFYRIGDTAEMQHPTRLSAL